MAGGQRPGGGHRTAIGNHREERPLFFRTGQQGAAGGGVRPHQDSGTDRVWEVCNLLTTRGHGPLDKILNTYTLEHVERAVHDIHAGDLLDRINRVHDFRVAQIEDGKKFQQQYNRLLASYKRLVKAKPGRSILTPQEQALLDRQQHYDFNELSPQEQQQLNREVDSMWGQIPAHLQEKARKMAGMG